MRAAPHPSGRQDTQSAQPASSIGTTTSRDPARNWSQPASMTSSRGHAQGRGTGSGKKRSPRVRSTTSYRSPARRSFSRMASAQPRKLLTVPRQDDMLYLP